MPIHGSLRRRRCLGPGFGDGPDKRTQNLRHALARHSRYDERRLLGGALKPHRLLLQLRRCQCIGLVERYDLRLVDKEFAVSPKFGSHRLVGLPGMVAGSIDEMQERTATLHMAEESVAKSSALVGAFDQARNV